MPGDSIAYDAQKKAELALTQIIAHEDLCAERYANIHSSLNRVWKIFAWAGGTGFLIMISVLGFFLKAQSDALLELTKANEMHATQVSQPPQVYIQPAAGNPPITGATVERQQPQR